MRRELVTLYRRGQVQDAPPYKLLSALVPASSKPKPKPQHTRPRVPQKGLSFVIGRGVVQNQNQNHNTRDRGWPERACHSVILSLAGGGGGADDK